MKINLLEYPKTRLRKIVFFLDTFMVEDAVEAIGFGKFQWKLSVITGLAWASNCYQDELHDDPLQNPSDFKFCSRSL